MSIRSQEKNQKCCRGFMCNKIKPLPEPFSLPPLHCKRTNNKGRKYRRDCSIPANEGGSCFIWGKKRGCYNSKRARQMCGKAGVGCVNKSNSSCCCCTHESRCNKNYAKATFGIVNKNGELTPRRKSVQRELREYRYDEGEPAENSTTPTIVTWQPGVFTLKVEPQKENTNESTRSRTCKTQTPLAF